MNENEQDHSDRNHSDLELKTGFGSFRARGYDGMMILLVVAMTGLASGTIYLVSQVREAAFAIMKSMTALESSQANTAREQARTIMTSIAALESAQSLMIKSIGMSMQSQREAMISQRLMQCVMAQRESVRMDQLLQPDSLCNKMAKYPPGP